MRVNLILRRPSGQRHFSIERVFDDVTRNAPSTVEIIPTELPRAGLSAGAVLANIRCVRRIDRGVVHMTGDAHYVVPFVRRGVPSVLTIHDLHTITRLRGIRRRIYRFFWFTLPLRFATHVTAVSSFTAEALKSEFDITADRITVIENPVSDAFGPSPSLSDPGGRSVLVIGTAANKNVRRIAEAVAGVGYQMRLIGETTPELRGWLDELGLEWSSAAGLSDEELVREYQRANVLCFASTSEGFGMPISEAFACRLPVVTSALSPMQDVAAGAGILVDPHSVTDIARGLRLAFESRDDTRARVQLGEEIARRRTGRVAAASYADVCLEVAANDRDELGCRSETQGGGDAATSF